LGEKSAHSVYFCALWEYKGEKNRFYSCAEKKRRMMKIEGWETRQTMYV
jgi:hypothetical protein